jgi:hypothetical protein
LVKHNKVFCKIDHKASEEACGEECGEKVKREESSRLIDLSIAPRWSNQQVNLQF